MSGWRGDLEFPSRRRDAIETELGQKLDDAVWRSVDNIVEPFLRERAAEDRELGFGSRGNYTDEHRKLIRHFDEMREKLCELYDLSAGFQPDPHALSAMDFALQQKTGRSARLRKNLRKFEKDLESAAQLAARIDMDLEPSASPVPDERDLYAERARCVQRLQKELTGQIDTSAPRTLRVGGLTDFQRFVRALRLYEPPLSDKSWAETLSNDLKRDLQN